MLLYDIQVPEVDLEVGNSWNEFLVGVFFEKYDGYAMSKDSDKYFKKWAELVDKKIEAHHTERDGKGFFSYRVDITRPIEDFIGILEVGTKVVVFAYDERYDGVVVGDGNEPTIDDVNNYFGN